MSTLVSINSFGRAYGKSVYTSMELRRLGYRELGLYNNNMYTIPLPATNAPIHAKISYSQSQLRLMHSSKTDNSKYAAIPYLYSSNRNILSTLNPDLVNLLVVIERDLGQN